MAERSGEIDVSRRTWLAAERTWLAWWRTGVSVGAVAVAVGRFLPGVTTGPRWPFHVLGIGYGLLAVVTLAVGAARQKRTARALTEGGYYELSSPLTSWLTGLAVVLTIGATVVVAAAA